MFIIKKKAQNSPQNIAKGTVISQLGEYDEIKWAQSAYNMFIKLNPDYKQVSDCEYSHMFMDWENDICYTISIYQE